MKEDIKINHHYVPIGYLKAWSNHECSDQLSILRNNTKSFSLTPKNINYEKHGNKLFGKQTENEKKIVGIYLGAFKNPHPLCYKSLVDVINVINETRNGLDLSKLLIEKYPSTR